MNATCERCGFTPKNPAKSLYYSAMSGQTQCDDGAACHRRAVKRWAAASNEMPSRPGPDYPS